MSDYVIRSGEAAHKANPKTFHIPPAAKRRDVGLGQLVRMIFDPSDGSHHGEKMWVIVTQRVKGGYVGQLGNIPSQFDRAVLKLHDLVKFRFEHIVDIRDGQGPRPS